MRKFLASMAAAGALAAVAAAPVAAELDLCIVDPPVQVGDSTLQVGLYTHDPALADGGILNTRPITVTLIGENVSTVVSAWKVSHPSTGDRVSVNVVNRDGSASNALEIDAFVPSSISNDSFFIKVTFPNGSVRTVAGPVNTLVKMHVLVPAQG